MVLQADRLDLLSDEHFTVDGTLIEAAASLKSFRPKDEPPSEGGGTAADNPANRWVDFPWRAALERDAPEPHGSRCAVAEDVNPGETSWLGNY